MNRAEIEARKDELKGFIHDTLRKIEEKKNDVHPELVDAWVSHIEYSEDELNYLDGLVTSEEEEAWLAPKKEW